MEVKGEIKVKKKLEIDRFLNVPCEATPIAQRKLPAGNYHKN
jgi:hypothetical protein